MQGYYSNPTGLSIKEVSSLVGISASTLRNIEAFFGVPVERNRAGQRTYTENNLNFFKQVKKYTSEGLQYAEIKPLLTIAVEGCSNATSFEVISDPIQKHEQDFNIIIKPFENRITELKTYNLELLEENKLLNRDNATLIERVKNKDDIISFQDNSIKEYKERLAKLENKQWWRFWKN